MKKKLSLILAICTMFSMSTVALAAEPEYKSMMDDAETRQKILASAYADNVAPNNYSIDYIFASVMAAKPLMWTELSSLSEEDAHHLKSIISVYKKYRDDFVSVSPIFDEPNGFSLTGFYIAGQKNNYVILIREFCENDTFENVTVKEVLYTNDCDAELAPARLTKKASYLFGIV